MEPISLSAKSNEIVLWHYNYLRSTPCHVTSHALISSHTYHLTTCLSSLDWLQRILSIALASQLHCCVKWLSFTITNAWDNKLKNKIFILAHSFTGFHLWWVKCIACMVATCGKVWSSKTAHLMARTWKKTKR
jgi:hypothetical protein